MLNFIGFFSYYLKKSITHARYAQGSRQVSVAKKLYAGFFGILSTSNNKILFDEQVIEINEKKLSTKPNTYDTPQDNTTSTPITLSLSQTLSNQHPLKIIPQNHRNALTAAQHIHQNNNMQRNFISHIKFQTQSTNDTYKQIIENPHKKFHSQNNQLFSPRRAERLDPSIVHFPVSLTSTEATLLSQFQTSLLPLTPFSPSLYLNHHTLTRKTQPRSRHTR